MPMAADDRSDAAQPDRDAAAADGGPESGRPDPDRPDPDREVRLLVRFLSQQGRFRFGVATYDTVPRRDAVIAHAAAELAARAVDATLLDLGGGRRRTLLIEELRRHLAEHPAAPGRGRAVMVTGLESLVDLWSPSPAGDAFAVFQNANLHRDLFPEVCPAPLVLWLSPFATLAFARHAPDLWDWRATTFDVTEPAAERMAVAPRQAIGLERDDYWNEPPEKLHQHAAMFQDLLCQLGEPGPDEAPRTRTHRAHLLLELGRVRHRLGDWDAALRGFQDALALVVGLAGEADDDVAGAIERTRAIILGEIANVLHERGEIDEALRIRREEELPVYERLGDVRSLLIARANIAMALLDRGHAGDRAEAADLLGRALAEAERLRLPEAGIIREILERHDLAGP